MNIKQKTESIQIEDIHLFYEVYGSGENVILCFHGNDRSATDFEFLSQPNRKIVSVYLPFHGLSTFDLKRVKNGSFSTPLLVSAIQKIQEKEEMNKFHLLAYSQGGRFALCIFPYFKNSVLSFQLIAPDGMSNYSFYSWSQRQGWARQLFRRWLKKPKELMMIVHFLVKLKVIAPKMIEFMEHYSSDKERFHQSYNTWAGFRSLKPNYSKLKKELGASSLPFCIFAGRHDQIITVKSVSKFLNRIDFPSALKITPFGHNVFKEDIKKEWKNLLNFPFEIRR